MITFTRAGECRMVSDSSVHPRVWPVAYILARGPGRTGSVGVPCYELYGLTDEEIPIVEGATQG